MVFGKMHNPYRRILPMEPAEPIHYHHAMIIRTIIKLKDDNLRGSYVLLTINVGSSNTDNESIQIEFICLDFDIERAAIAAEDTPCLLSMPACCVMKNSKLYSMSVFQAMRPNSSTEINSSGSYKLNLVNMQEGSCFLGIEQDADYKRFCEITPSFDQNVLVRFIRQ